MNITTTLDYGFMANTEIKGFLRRWTNLYTIYSWKFQEKYVTYVTHKATHNLEQI